MPCAQCGVWIDRPVWINVCPAGPLPIPQGATVVDGWVRVAVCPLCSALRELAEAHQQLLRLNQPAVLDQFADSVRGFVAEIQRRFSRYL